MLSRLTVLMLLIGLLGCANGELRSGRAERCSMKPVDKLPLTTQLGLVAVPVQLNGRPFAMVLDTGAARTLIFSRVAAELQLRADPQHQTSLFDLGGTSQRQNDVLFDRIAVGPKSFKLGHVPVIDIQRHDAMQPPLAGYLGADILGQFDLDLDLPHQRLTLWRVTGFTGDFIPWQEAHVSLVAGKSRNGWLILSVKLDGQELSGVLDTGAGGTAIMRDAAAARFGAAQGAHEQSRLPIRMVISQPIDGTLHRFRRFDVGPVRQINPAIMIADAMLPDGDMLIAWPTLRQHRIWLSYATGQVFIANTPVAGH